MKNVERHQIKRDELVTLLERIALALEGNTRRVVWIGAAVVLIGLTGLGLRSWMSRREAAASFLAGEMIQTYRAPVTTSLEDLQAAPGGVRTYATTLERDGRVLELAEDLLARYGRSGAAPEARYYRGLALAGLGRTDEARAAFEDLLRRDPRDFLAPLARMQLARMLESAGQPADALAHYEALTADSRIRFPREEGLLGVARCQEALGRKEDALKTYRRIVSDFPDSDYQFEARRKVDDLS